MADLHFWYSVLLTALTVTLVWWRNKKRHDPKPALPHDTHHHYEELPSDYNDIEPLEDFDLNTAEPVQTRPWKPKYHLTMGLEKCNFSDILPIDKTLEERLALRRKIVREHSDVVIASDPCSGAAVKEFYSYSFLKRQGDTYVAKALILCYAFAFTPSLKLNQTLAGIHGPVPGYKKKLERPMNRYFTSLPKGKVVKRHNWNISISRGLFETKENPLTVLPVWLMGWIRTVFDWLGIEVLQMKTADLDPEEMNARCERQTLHRLMENDNMLVFSFRTYQYPLKQIRDEGGGPTLAEAIRGINRGSVPAVEWYKASPYWGRAAMEYLCGGGSEKPGEIRK
ncbi:hypothetical protein FVEG_13804 [Fusarium verticillioides 7600]|uniref:Uncharacterized protein n=1 Tax=Gibberella moniliformis (strain M3125 / FGSC 7600) TaxID=334819 RepID=W7NHF7_GIBM7|nr:hypothetical protein FVEG_13804 [Fusarium verticillioides 7600]EWG55862.1 hypothetical protein FVEG_13804 [Fusarium verticillioides 7600]